MAVANPRPYAPILKIAQIDDSINASAGDITNWAPNLANAPAAGSAYGLIVTNQNSLGSALPSIRDVPHGHFQAEKIWNSVWNDYADLQLLADELIPGKCYFDTYDGAKICNERCQLSVIGIASNTFAQAVGKRSDTKQVPIAVAGWVLAFVDKEYPCGTPLTNNEFGELTEMTREEKMYYPERLVATYKRAELEEYFGSESSKVLVNKRHWVKVK